MAGFKVTSKNIAHDEAPAIYVNAGKNNINIMFDRHGHHVTSEHDDMHEALTLLAMAPIGTTLLCAKWNAALFCFAELQFEKL